MTAPDRIPCINPRCKRTAPRDKYAADVQIVCGKCWRALPQAMRDRDRSLRKRERRLLRLVEKRIARGTIDGRTIEQVRVTYQKAFRRNWQRIRNYFREPERPIGLEGFLQEVGL